MDSLLNYILMKAFGRGLRGHHPAWLVIVVAVWMLNRARHREDVVFRTELKPGERLIVRTLQPPSASSRGR